ncbi:Centrosomal protein of 83 kDa-like [Oopsacas minuta]|uniref:Centrosomal protein of 83 kDa-like n=1 Tax=Oopsacas minuta TaxID=111878 RepID=A0AAV7K827_9METZ|nr:Centrosomal protein of 83 kDa-like [Oopsacas minuta]
MDPTIPDRVSTELKTALAEERLVSETHLSDLETLRTEYLCLQQVHGKLKADNDNIKSRLGHLQQTARDALGRGEAERGTLLEQIQALRANQLTPERIEILKADIAEGIEHITQEKVDRIASESDQLRQELSKIRYNYTFLKSEYEHEVGRRNAIVEETERKHVIEICRLKKERDQLLTRLSSETEIDAKEMRVVARENAHLKQKISSIQADLDVYREQGDERLVQTEELGQQIKSQLTDTMIHVSSLEAEKATLSLQVERTQTELTRTRNQLQETVKESGKVKENLSEALNQLEEMAHKHKMEITEVRMQNEMRVGEMDETHGKLTVKIRSLADQISDLDEQLIANENKSRDQERITAEKIQFVKESEWAKIGELQENRIILETKVTELEAVISGRETEFSLQLEQSQDKILILQSELSGSLKNKEQLEDQLQEMKLQVSELHKEIIQHRSNMKKFTQLKNQYQSLAGSEQEYKQTNEQLNSRCLLLEEEVKRCQYDHERILADLQTGYERSREEITDEVNKLNLTAQELSLDKDKLRKQLERILRSARKMKQKYRQKLNEYAESLSMCKAERDKIEASNLAQKYSFESENERLCKKLAELQRRQHEFNFLIHNQEPQKTRITDDVISVEATDNTDSNAKEIELLNRKLENLTARHSQMLANLKEQSVHPLPVDNENEHQSDYHAKD